MNDLGEILSTYFMYDNAMENKNPVDLATDLYNIK